VHKHYGIYIKKKGVKVYFPLGLNIKQDEMYW